MFNGHWSCYLFVPFASVTCPSFCIRVASFLECNSVIVRIDKIVIHNTNQWWVNNGEAITHCSTHNIQSCWPKFLNMPQWKLFAINAPHLWVNINAFSIAIEALSTWAYKRCWIIFWFCRIIFLEDNFTIKYMSLMLRIY